MGKFDLCTLAVSQKVLMRYKRASVLRASLTNRHSMLDFQDKMTDKHQPPLIHNRKIGLRAYSRVGLRALDKILVAASLRLIKTLELWLGL